MPPNAAVPMPAPDAPAPNGPLRERPRMAVANTLPSTWPKRGFAMGMLLIREIETSLSTTSRDTV
jgi:hypothetical protein